MPSIRRATPADAERLSAVAQAAKRHWGYPEPWLEFWRADLTLTPEQVAAGDMFVIETAGAVVGFYAMLPGAPRWTLDHLWVDPSRLRQGLGRHLVAHALARARAAGAVGLDIEVDPNAESFYCRLGGVRVGEIAAPVPGGGDRRLPLLVLDEIVTL